MTWKDGEDQNSSADFKTKGLFSSFKYWVRGVFMMNAFAFY